MDKESAEESDSQNVVITAGNSDIARAFAAALANQTNSRVLVTTRRKSYEGEQGENWRILPELDLCNDDCLRKLADAVKEHFPGRFSVVHFAGDFWRHVPLVDTSYSTFRSMIESHYLTLCGVAWALTPVLIERGGGQLIAFSCNSVGYAYPDMAPFTAAKGAVETFIRCYAHEHAEYGITANVLALPTIKTATVVSEKIVGDKDNYITPEELSNSLLENILRAGPNMTGNVIKMYRYSPTFYGQGYFQRNPRRT